MFDRIRKKIKTKNLYLVKLVPITKYISNHVQGTEIYFGKEYRYVLAYRADITKTHTIFPAYVDCFTGTIYRDKLEAREGEECFLKTKALLTNRDYITLEEATYILKELNPTYLPELTEQPSLLRGLSLKSKLKEDN